MMRDEWSAHDCNTIDRRAAQHQDREAGSIMLTFLLCLLVLLGFCALTLDLSRLFIARGLLQGAADAAALAGARELNNTTVGTQNAVTVAQAVLNHYRLTLENNAAIDLSQVSFRVGPCANPNSGSSTQSDDTVSAPHWQAATAPTCSFVGLSATSSAGLGNATGLNYLEVDTGNQPALASHWAQTLVWGNAFNTAMTPLTTFGYAVAGFTAPTTVQLYQ
jgi:Flp pilus assembly protein TadG